MSVYATIDGEIADQVASNRGWGDFGRWADSLSAEDYPQVIHLFDHGWTQRLPELVQQLSAAARSEGPPPDVASVVDSLLQILSEHDSAEVLTVSGGFAPNGETTIAECACESELIDLPDVRQPDPYSCILPGQELQGRVIGGSKARYSGEAVEIHTASGAVLSVTTNHPVLTMMGFVAAGDLTEGQNLLHYVGENKAALCSNDKQQAPALVEDVFSSFFNVAGAVLTPEKVRCAPFDFHGDAERFQGDVEVVGSYSTLRRNGAANSSQAFTKRDFVGSNSGLIAETCSRRFHLGFQRSSACTRCFVGSNGLGIARARAHARPDQSASLAPAPQLKSVVSKGASEELLSEPMQAAKSLQRRAGFVQADKFVEVRDCRANNGPLLGASQDTITALGESGSDSLSANAEFFGKVGGCLAGKMSLHHSVNVADGNAGTEAHESIRLGPASPFDATRTESARKHLATDAVFVGQQSKRIPSVVALDQFGKIRDEPVLPSINRLQKPLTLFVPVDILPSKENRFGPASSLHAPLPKNRPYGVSSDAVLARHLLQGFAGQIVSDEIVNLRRFHYDGPVYDFESPEGFIVVSGLCISNCGAAASMSVGLYFGVGPANVEEWKTLLGTNPEDGTTPEAIIKVFTDLGLQVIQAEDMTIEELESYCGRGIPVLCPIQEYGQEGTAVGWDDGHWVAVCGVALGKVIVQDPSLDNILSPEGGDESPGKMLIDQDRFLQVWQDQGGGRRYVRYGIAVGRKGQASV